MPHNLLCKFLLLAREPSARMAMMFDTISDKIILLVEDNPNDEELTKIAFRRNNILNPIVVAHNGVEALDFLFASGIYAGRDIFDQPLVIILDLNLPKVNGH